MTSLVDQRDVLGAVMLALGLLWAGSFTRDAIRMHTVWGSGALATEPDAGGHDRGRARLVNLADLAPDLTLRTG